MPYPQSLLCLASINQEWIPVIDTGIKVGLGAFIAGATGLATNWLRAKTDKEQLLLKHEFESSKYFLERELDRLEQAISCSHEYFESINKYLNIVGGFLAGLPLELRANGCMIDNIDQRLASRFNHELKNLESQQIELQSARNRAITLFGLIGEEDLCDSSGKSLKDFEAMRRSICVEKKLSSWDEFEQITKEYQESRIRLKKLSAEAYGRRREYLTASFSTKRQ